MTLLDQDGNAIKPIKKAYEQMDGIVEQVLYHDTIENEHFLCVSTTDGPILMFICPDFKYAIQFDWRDRDASALISILADFAMEEISFAASNVEYDRPWKIPGVDLLPNQAARIYNSASQARALKEMKKDDKCIRVREGSN